MALREELTRLFAQFQQLDHQRFIPDNRNKIGTIFVEPLLKTLGYDLGNNLEVERGGENDFLREDLPDYTVSINAKASIYLEIRSPYEAIRKEDLIDIANATYRGDIGIITNGIYFQVFILPRDDQAFQFLFEFSFREPISQELIEQLTLLTKPVYDDNIPSQLLSISHDDTPTTIQPMLKEIKEKAVTTTPVTPPVKREQGHFKAQQQQHFFTEQQWSKMRSIAWIIVVLGAWSIIQHLRFLIQFSIGTYTIGAVMTIALQGAAVFYTFKFAQTKDLKRDAVRFVPILIWITLGFIAVPLVKGLFFRPFGF